VFEFSNTSCVVVGTFNIYIVQPHWLSEVEIIPSKTKVAIQADMRSPGFKFKLPDNVDLSWNIRPDRLSTQSERLDVDCGKPIAQVLKKLPWTPVTAVGCNAAFIASLDHYDKISHLFSSDSLADEYKLAQKTWHRGIRRNHLTLNIQLSVTDDSIELSLNAHTEAKKGCTIRTANEVAQGACTSFIAQRDEAIQLARSLLNVEF
jgi:hypothetical protein